MTRKTVLLVLACLGLACFGPVTTGRTAPPGPTERKQSIATSRSTIEAYGKMLRDYDEEMRKTVANDPAATRRREEIRILKRYYTQEIEALKAKIIDDYKKIQEYRASGDRE